MRISSRGRFLFGFALSLILQAFFVNSFAADNSTNYPLNYFTFQPPSVGGSYADANFGTVVKRLTSALVTPNADSGGNLISITTEYSTVVPFNQDNSRILIAHQSYFALYDGAGNFLSNLPFEINTSSEPRWSRTDPNVIYYHFVNQLKEYNVSTGAKSVVHTFSEYSSISGKGESDISHDGNHFVLAGDNRYVFVYEISTDTMSPAFDTASRGFDSIYITPQNKVTITWLQSGTTRYSGIELYDRNMNFLRQVAHAGGHMDVTLDADGSEVLVWTNSADPLPLAGCENGFVKINLSSGQQTCLLSLDWSLAIHISGTDNSGWIIAETYAPGDPVPQTSNWVAYANEILQIKLDGTEVRRLLHHRSRPFNSYTWHPRVTVSRDGTRFIYDSNYGLQAILGYNSEYSDVYLASLSADSAGTSGSTSTGDGPTGAGGTAIGTTSSGLTNATTTTTRIEQNDSSVTYSSNWYTLTQERHSGGSAVGAMDAGSRATFTFTGTNVRWLGYRDEWSGTANIFLDGQLQAIVDTYASPAQTQKVIWGVTGLSSASHTLVIEATGSHNAPSAGSWIWIDSFEVDASSGDSTGVTSASISSDSSTTSSSSITHIEHDSTALTYEGAWFPNNLPIFSGGGAKLAMERHSKVTLNFTGTGVSWIGYRDAWSGIACIYLDRNLIGKIDTYAPSDTANAVIYKAVGLAQGNHTLTIVVTGKKNTSSAGAWVWVDALEVTP